MLEIFVVILGLALAGLGYYAFRQYQQLNQLKQTLNTVQNSNNDFEQRLKTQQVNKADYETKLTKADEIILKLRKSLAEKDTHINELQLQVNENSSTLSNLRGQIATSEFGTAESKALYNTVSSVAFDSVFVLNDEGIIIATNRAGDDIFDNKNPVGENLYDILGMPELREMIERTKDEDEDIEEQIVIDNHYYRARTKLIHYEKTKSFIGVAMQDITQLVRLNRARRDMVANISHELRTPIANIRMIIEGLFHTGEKPKRKASISTLRAILRETETLLWLVQELMDLSMIESGQAIMKLVPVTLYEVVSNSVTRLSDQMVQKEIKVAVFVPQKIQVLCDYEQTRRVFVNLIHNAIKWSPEKDTITINASYQGEEVLVSVFDNGLGVPDNQRERIFERFYQVDTARSGRESGSGLGLAICKHIVEAHGGRIWAEGNSLGGGGRFFFTLLSAEEEIVKPVPEMIRGQHDWLPVPQLSTTSNTMNDEDDREIELVDDDIPSTTS
jgi:two-component system, OmpR family, phosphate regulon sensor histidine kinase PhoR